MTTTDPFVSIIIPTYNGAKFLGETIQSVLGQTYSNFELIIVNDASPDDTNDLMKGFTDQRIKYILHEKNKGSDKARNTGLAASSGEIVAFLDQDDLYHAEKFKEHVAFLGLHPEVGATYNPRFNLNHSSNTIRDMWCPPSRVTLSDLVLGFPFAPSDVVLRREWALHMDLLNGSLSWCGGEIVHYGGLYLAGCKFASVERALNYRRYHAGRRFIDLRGGCESEIYAQDKIFADPRCPSDVIALRDLAHANMYMSWAYRAFIQEEAPLGQELLNEAISLNPSILIGMPCELIISYMMNSIDDETEDHEIILKKVFNQLPSDFPELSAQFDLAVARGYLLKGFRAILWDRADVGCHHMEKAQLLGAVLDQPLINQIAHNLLNYQAEFGDFAVEQKLEVLKPYFEQLAGRTGFRQLASCYAINHAFRNYRSGDYREVPMVALKAVENDPKLLANRGVWSIFLKSFVQMWKAQTPT